MASLVPFLKALSRFRVPSASVITGCQRPSFVLTIVPVGGFVSFLSAI
ncbi:MAG: hypothetical protein WDO69_24300 [Pseudomonadota bacterium]